MIFGKDTQIADGRKHFVAVPFNVFDVLNTTTRADQELAASK